MEPRTDINMLNAQIDRLYEQVEEEQEMLFRSETAEECVTRKNKIEKLIKDIRTLEAQLDKLE